jgi:hypothetical protein
LADQKGGFGKQRRSGLSAASFVQPKLPLLLLMAVLSEALFALVSSHLMSFSFFSARHSFAV